VRVEHIEKAVSIYPEESTDIKKKIADRVYILTYPSMDKPMLVHHCEGHTWFKEMTYRENFDGPNYWCGGCGYELPEGTAMAVRMNELEL
jgi:hypothetical protein